MKNIVNKNFNAILISIFFIICSLLFSLIGRWYAKTRILNSQATQCQQNIITSEPYTIVYHQPYSDKILKACQEDENCIDIMLLEDLITRDEYQEFISQLDI